MATSVTVDMSDFNSAVSRLYRMGDVKKSDIARIFRTASKPQITTAKQLAGKSRRGSFSKQYPSRTHPAGFLRKSIKFSASKKYKFVYYVNSGAWYSMIYIGGHGKWKGNPFMDKAIGSTESSVNTNIQQGLFSLIGRQWDGR